ncbi:MAG: hypothetical protein IPJ07_23070 [Acidobacteria bacterium]|nr:hypothetical protein [Acidobacteriota bacterium]
MMILNRVAGNLAASGAQIGNVAGLVFDDQEVGYSFTANLPFCQYKNTLLKYLPETDQPVQQGHPGRQNRLDQTLVTG